MKNKILLIIFIVASFFNANFIAHSEESIEDIIKGRKAIFSNNAKLAKRVNILSVSYTHLTLPTTLVV